MGLVKAIILIGGPQKGTRFRPLSFQVPKPLFPIAGYPMIQHHIEACSRLPDCKEIIILGYYQPTAELKKFIQFAQKEHGVLIR
jgi:mannose-1-phosphate guanylyltransferase